MSSTAAECPICLNSLASESVSLGCGHIFHQACFSLAKGQGHAGAGGAPLACPVCRAPVDEARTRRASAVLGAAADGGFRGFAQRSALHAGVAPPRAPPPAGGAAMPPTPALRGGPASRGDGGELLRLVSEQLGAAETAAPAGIAGSTWLFCLDVSSSMGSSRDWSASRASRLCFALAALASTVNSQVATGDWISVVAYDQEVATLQDWHRKPADFEPASFLSGMAAAVDSCDLERYGTHTCKAVTHAMLALAEQANRAPAGATHSLVLLTDGVADDELNCLDTARGLMREPPLEAGGFRGLLMHIDCWVGAFSCLTRLAHGLPYVQLLQLRLGRSLNLSRPQEERSARDMGLAIRSFSGSTSLSAAYRRAH